MSAARFTVRGQKVISRSQRRFVAVAVRPEHVHVDDEQRWDYRTESYVSTGPATYVAFAEIIKRSDSVATVRKAAANYGRHQGAFAVVVDTATGEEI